MAGRLRRGEERRLITFANCAKPVAEVGVDGRDDKSVRSLGLGKQGRGRSDARQRHAERHGETARRGEADPHAGEAAGPDGYRNQRQLAARHAGFFERRGDGRQQRSSLITPLGAMAGERL